MSTTGALSVFSAPNFGFSTAYYTILFLSSHANDMRVNSLLHLTPWKCCANNSHHVILKCLKCTACFSIIPVFISLCGSVDELLCHHGRVSGVRHAFFSHFGGFWSVQMFSIPNVELLECRTSLIPTTWMCLKCACGIFIWQHWGKKNRFHMKACLFERYVFFSSQNT